MPEYTLRNTKGSELTFTEVDNNFIAARTAGRLHANSALVPQSGYYLNQSFGGAGLVENLGPTTTSTIQLTPFYVGWDTTIDQLGVWQTSAPSITIRLLIYSSDSSGRPSTKLYESGDIVTASGANEVASSFTFTANTQYWVGTHSSSTAYFRNIPATSLLPIGLSGLNTTGQGNCIIAGGVVVGSAPSSWTFNNSQIGTAANGVVGIGFRVA